MTETTNAPLTAATVRTIRDASAAGDSITDIAGLAATTNAVAARIAHADSEDEAIRVAKAIWARDAYWHLSGHVVADDISDAALAVWTVIVRGIEEATAVGLDPAKLIDAVTNGVGC
ncbi:hypothetical protein [Williamsia deligens]|uniref:Uncharacterized protein n=1 Tax=Williamsia deligens TaxID=321325 RepID=A0ABW3G885_9NOCA|nr:hypothetical protein [Williamsia deligens]MCP2195679.1 hypothetical protein [Williamsia deligens]